MDDLDKLRTELDTDTYGGEEPGPNLERVRALVWSLIDEGRGPEAYTAVVGFDAAGGQLSRFPVRMQTALISYVLFGAPPGGFLTAVLSNDLRGTLAGADRENKPLIEEYVRFLFSCAPDACSGSKARVVEWIGRGGILPPAYNNEREGI